jgi:hypothetical protein
MDGPRPSTRQFFVSAGLESLESRTMFSGGVTSAKPVAPTPPVSAKTTSKTVVPLIKTPAAATKPTRTVPVHPTKPAPVFRVKTPPKKTPIPSPPKTTTPAPTTTTTTTTTAPPVPSTTTTTPPAPSPIVSVPPTTPKNSGPPLPGSIPTLLGDLNADGIVDNADFKILHANYGKPNMGAGDGDLNGDGRITFTDFQILEANFGKTIARTHYATVGTNLDGIADYSTISPFVDMTRMFRNWGRPLTAYEPDPTIQRTADNYPLEDAGAITYARTYPNGVYQVSWDGNADLSFVATGVSFTVTGHNGDHWTGGLTLNRAGDDVITMYVKNIDQADPLHNLHIISPDVDYNISDTFRPVFLQKLAPFNGYLRMMDWMQTNDNPSVEWSDRTTPQTFSNVNSTGVDLETIVKLANTLHKDLWINIPYHASDDYITRTARLIRDQLDPSLKVYVENSNEVWNNGFQQSRDNAAAAASDTSLTRQDDFGRQAEESSKLIVRISQIFRQEFGDNDYNSRVRTVFGAFIATTYWAQSALNYIELTYGPPSQFVSEIAIAPYVGVPGDMAAIDNDNLTLDGLFTWMNGFINGQLKPWIQQHKALADFYGVGLQSYEGGQSLQAVNGRNEAVKQAAQDDPRMADVYRNLIQTWHDASGGGTFGNFALATNYTPFGYWGLLQDIGQATSVKWEAVMSTIAN